MLQAYGGGNLNTLKMEGEAARETSEGRAVRSVPASAPECLNLRKVLDEAFASEASGKLDVQPVRRLVAALEVAAMPSPVLAAPAAPLAAPGLWRAVDPAGRPH